MRRQPHNCTFLQVQFKSLLLLKLYKTIYLTRFPKYIISIFAPINVPYVQKVFFNSRKTNVHKRLYSSSIYQFTKSHEIGHRTNKHFMYALDKRSIQNRLTSSQNIYYHRLHAKQRNAGQRRKKCTQVSHGSYVLILLFSRDNLHIT